MTRSLKSFGLSLQLGVIAFITAACLPAQAMLVCKVNAEAKDIPIYDKPGGAELRRADVDPGWKSGSVQPAHEQGADGMLGMWLEIQDQSGATIGFVKVGDGAAACTGGF